MTSLARLSASLDAAAATRGAHWLRLVLTAVLVLAPAVIAWLCAALTGDLYICASVAVAMGMIAVVFETARWPASARTARPVTARLRRAATRVVATSFVGVGAAVYLWLAVEYPTAEALLLPFLVVAFIGLVTRRALRFVVRTHAEWRAETAAMSPAASQ